MAQQSKLDIEKYVNGLAQSVLAETEPRRGEPRSAEPRPQATPQAESNTSRGCTPAEMSPVREPAAGGLAPSLKGQAVELWRDGRRFFLVADEEDAQEAIRRFGAHRGEVWTGAELELVASIPDQATRDEMESFKREIDGRLTPDAAGKGTPWAQYQAERLNELFRTQGVTGQPAKITATTVRHGERGGHK